MASLGQLVVELVANTAKFQTDMRQVSQSMEDVGRKVSATNQIFNTFAGVSLSRVAEQLVDLTRKAIEMGRASEQAEYAFANLAQRAGVSATALSTALQEAANRTVDFSNIARAAARGLQEDFAPEQLVELMKIARANSILTGQSVEEAFNDIATAVANGQLRMLKFHGIVIDGTKALQDYARSMGVDADMLTEAGKAQAYYNAVLDATRGRLVDVNNEVVRHKEAHEQMAAVVSEIWSSLGKTILGTIYNMGSAVMRAIEEIRNDPLVQWMLRMGDRAATFLFGPAETAAPALGAGLPNFTATGIAPGTGMLGLQPGTSMIAMTGGAPGSAFIDEERRRRVMGLAAAQAELARTTGGLAVAEKAYQLASQDQIDVLKQQLDAVDLLTAALLKDNAARQALGDPAQARAAVVEVEKIRADQLVKRLELLRQVRDAEYALNVATASKMVTSVEAWEAYEESIRKAYAEQDRLRFEEEKAAQPSTEKLVEMTEAWMRFEQSVEAAYQKQDLARYLERLGKIQAVTAPIFDSLRNAVSGTVAGILLGTQTVSQAFANMGRNIAAALIENVINRGLKAVQAALEAFLADLAQSGLLTQALKTGAAAFTGALTPTPTAAAIPLQHGGIVTRPTLAMVGESGPEAVVPLGGRGPMVEININNQHPGAQITQTTRRSATGTEIHDIIVQEVKRMVGNGEFDGMMSPYALRRVPTGR